MDLHLQGKRALVTGSSSGIGEGIAQALAQEGAIVLVHGREQSRAKPIVEAIVAQGGSAFAVGGDVATNEGASQVISQALSYVDGIDILVNNAAAFSFQGWAAATPEEWGTIYNGNVLAAVRLIQAVSEQMKTRQWDGLFKLPVARPSSLLLSRPSMPRRKLRWSTSHSASRKTWRGQASL